MSDPDLHARATALFLEVRQAPAEQRDQLLQASAGSDQPLLNEVRSLLQHDVADQPTSGRGLQSMTRLSLIDNVRAESIPNQIGPYRIIRKIGRGGSGVVLLAEQHEPVERRVAVKIVPHAAIDSEYAARFDVERAALERTDHPNIARILDAGRTVDGLPYLVMDYIEGVPITQHCVEHRLPLHDRLMLMLDVADAVQHAHQRGVIHRDLKPANILVGDVAGRPTPRVVDFGIAKPIAEMWMGRDSPPTAGLPVGTPAYMAPEQAGFGESSIRNGVDTRADVYALAAVVYELVCGQPPHEIIQDDPLETLRRIREQVPPPASRVRARCRERDTSELLSRAAMVDLDCVLAKALEKNPARRYPTASAFADDLRRILRREPIEARPPTIAYRAARFVERNRVLVAGIALACVGVVVVLVAQTIAWTEAQRQRAEAVNQTEAQREINRFLTDDLLAAVTPEEDGHTISALELLQRASARVDQRFALRPLIAASIHHTLGVSFLSLGAFDDAERHLSRACDLRLASQGPNAPDALRSQIALATVRARHDVLSDRNDDFITLIARARLILGENDPALFAAIHELGVVRESQDRGQESVALLREALAGRTRLLGERDPQVLMTLSALAMAYERVGDEETSLQIQLDALRIAETIQPPPRMALLGLNNNVGATYQDLNRDALAEPYLKKAVELARDWLGSDHPDTLTITMNLASLESELGDPDSALELIKQVVDGRMRTLGPSAFETLLARYSLWNIHYKARRYREAADGFAILLPEIAAAMGHQHWITVQTRASLALALFDDDRPSEALPHAEMSVEQFMAMYGPEHSRTVGTVSTLNRIRDALANLPR